MSDGSITFDTKLNTKSLQKDLKAIQDEIEKTTGKLNANESESNQKIRAAAKQGVGLTNSLGESKSAEEVRAQADALDQERLSLNAELKNLYEQETSTKEQLNTALAEEAAQNAEIAEQAARRKEQEDQINAEIEKQDSVLSRLLEKQAKMSETGIPESSRQWKNNQYEIQKTKEKLEELAQSLKEVNQQSGSSLQARLEGINSSFENVGQTAETSGGLIADSLKGQITGAMNSVLSIGNMVKMRFKRMFISAIVNTIKEGFSNLIQYDDAVNQSVNNLKSSVSSLGNNFAAAFAPLITVVAPILATFINWVSDAIAVVSRLFAILSGKNTYTRAVKGANDVAKGIGGTGKAAKDATKAVKEEKKALASFDDLEILDFGKDSGGSGAGSGGGGSGSAGTTVQFEEVPVGDVSLITDKLKEIADLFKSGFLDGLGDYESKLKDIKANVLSIRDSLVDIATDPDVKGAFSGLIETFIYDLGSLTGSAASIGLSIAQLLTGGIAVGLDESRDSLKNSLVVTFNNLGLVFNDFAEFGKSLATIFEAVGGESAQTLVGSFLKFLLVGTSDILAVLSGFADQVLQFLISPISGGNADLVKSCLDGIFSFFEDTAGSILDTLSNMADTFLSVWNDDIQPILQAFNDRFHDVWTYIWQLWLTYLKPAFDAVGQTFKEVWETMLDPVLIELEKTFGDVFHSVGELALWLWDYCLKPLMKFIADTFAPILSVAIQGIGTVVSATVGIIGGLISGISDVLRGLIQFLRGAFTGDWRMAWEGLKNVLRGVVNGIISIVENMANAVVKGLNRLSFNVPSWVPGLGGKHFGFNMRGVSLPRLATGTVVPPNAGEFAAILGDNKRETEVVSPLSTMKAAMIEALKESGMYVNIERYMERIIEILLEILDKDPRATITVSEIIDAIKEKNKRDGKTIIPVG